MKFLRLLPELSRFRPQPFFGSRHHTQEELCFSRLLFAGADALLKVFPRNAFVCLAIICANAGGCTNQLINESIISRTPRDFLRESNDGFTETGRSFL